MDDERDRSTPVYFIVLVLGLLLLLCIGLPVALALLGLWDYVLAFFRGG